MKKMLLIIKLLLSWYVVNWIVKINFLCCNFFELNLVELFIYGVNSVLGDDLMEFYWWLRYVFNLYGNKVIFVKNRGCVVLVLVLLYVWNVCLWGFYC